MKVNKKVVVLAIAVVVAVAIFFSQSSMLLAPAQESKLKDVLKIDPNVQSVTAEPQPVDLSNSQVIDQKQSEKNVTIVDQAKQLISKGEKEYVTKGWLHMSSSTEAFETAQKTFPDGSPIPTKWTDENWILLDKKGDAIKAITIQDTGDPKLLQISVYENGVWTNISLGSTEAQVVYHPTFGGNILDAASMYKDNVKFSSETSMVNGLSTIVFSTEENLKTPRYEAKDKSKNNPMYGFVTKQYFAEISGVPVQTESYRINGAGSLEILNRTLMTVIEKAATPPADILAYFSHSYQQNHRSGRFWLECWDI